MATRKSDAPVSEHYARVSEEDIFAAVRAAGKDAAQLAPADLAPIDQFHTRGRDATLELARRAGLAEGMHVLDAGGGIGGAARTLAAEFGCRVTVLDLTETYCRIGEALTKATRLSDRVSFRHGSALDIPFDDQYFDAVWTQHSSMNIADKPQLYRELYRVVKRGGAFVMHEIMAGPNAPVHFPVPWARTPDISHLRLPEDAHQLIHFIGFQEKFWADESAAALEWFKARVAAMHNAPSPPPLGLHVLLGADFDAMFRNLVRNLDEQRIAVVQGVFKR